ncbi:chemotaxis protein CheD [Chromobacterium subtsugae]|uniref:Probable chemoreceptor glutamine deamidase CheD n=1 Tax=Chromobacterium subtsugae TaxID=251747 RepID=A0ABS7FCC5_9NEIS|nr:MULTISPECIES: chemotaxis protein CheD [Chromobacterium]KUM04663.1 chemotaxis protein CheD [Chromobacterium subtsugae]KZE85776.1 chemotaxis protein CheD [Chromobacterium sp. F49]MBW7566411.1 chemotaxis protein CheD [Chromobacterium subtsugae]MBW8287730.1 chemotaxis protein CheD [Chromobacterium subtsugae]WSE91062.1 chemotaxis protein CheD [Chromobacterium subtsugae]
MALTPPLPAAAPAPDSRPSATAAADAAGDAIFLHPGDWHFGGRGTRIRTLLGSCVSIILWHPQAQVGGMCHYLLAQRTNRRGEALSGRYGDEAMLLLLREILACGLPLQEFHARLIGGASMLISRERKLTHDVPARNISLARAMVKQLGLRLQAEDLGGNCPRLVLFDVASGNVWIKQSQEAELELVPPKNTRMRT